MKKKILACVLMFTLVFGGSVFVYANAFVGDDAGYASIAATGDSFQGNGSGGKWRPPLGPSICGRANCICGPTTGNN
jgi:hypothetical protein